MTNTVCAQVEAANAASPEAGITPMPLATTHRGMCQMLSVGDSTGWDLLRGPNPAIKSITIGRRRLPLIASIHEYVERKAAETYAKIADPPPGEGRRRHRKTATKI